MYDAIYFPVWLEYSGLPQHLNTTIRGGGWAVFKKLIELDCSANPEPGTVEIGMDELALRTGLKPQTVARVLGSLRKKGYIAAFVPDNFEEKGLFRIKVPLKTPLSFEEVAKRYKISIKAIQSSVSNRYAVELDPKGSQKRELQTVVDLYFSTISQKMNNFILDELQLIKLTFPMYRIKKVFEIAQRNDVKSLHWVVQQLYRELKKDGKAKNKKPRTG